MSYDISFKVKVEGLDRYVPLDYCDANITWNARDIIILSTGLPWEDEANNGYVRDVIQGIVRGLDELTKHPTKYTQYEAPNAWGTVEGTIYFFERILDSWDNLVEDDEELANVATFWIE